MTIKMMKGYGMPAAGTVDFSGFGSFDDYAANLFQGRAASPSLFAKIPALDGFGLAVTPLTGGGVRATRAYVAPAEPTADSAVGALNPGQMCAQTGGLWSVELQRCVYDTGPVLNHLPTYTEPPAPAPSSGLGKWLGIGAALFFAARMLK